MGRRAVVFLLSAVSMGAAFLVMTGVISTGFLSFLVLLATPILVIGATAMYVGRRTGKMQSMIVFVGVPVAFIFLTAAEVMRADNLTIFLMGIGGFVLAVIWAGEAYRWKLSRARLANSDGSGTLAFDDGSTGRALAPAPKGEVRVFGGHSATETAGYREDADPERFRVQLVAKGDARVRRVRQLALQLVVVSTICFMTFSAWITIDSQFPLEVQGSTCCGPI